MGITDIPIEEDEERRCDQNEEANVTPGAREEYSTTFKYVYLYYELSRLIYITKL